jgi:hypothetical protein
VESDAVRSGCVSVQQPPSQSSPPHQQAVAPLTKEDLLIVVFVSSIWLWAAVWATTYSAIQWVVPGLELDTMVQV